MRTNIIDKKRKKSYNRTKHDDYIDRLPFKNGRNGTIMDYILTNCKILNGKADMVPFSGQIVVKNGMIVRILQSNDLPDIFKGLKKIDLGGKYVMPGLINMHVHLAGNGKPQKKQRDNAKLVGFLMSNPLTKALAYSLVCKFAKLELLSGVTTIRTMGGLGDFDSKLRDESENGKKVAPRIIAANRGISVPGGHMAGSVAIAATSVKDALDILEANQKEGVNIVKLMITGGVLDAKEKGVPGELKMPAETIKAVCDKAHEYGYTVAAHVESTEGVKVALENGVDSIEHGAEPDDEIIELFKKRGAFVCTTISPTIPYALFDRSVTNITETELYNGKIVFKGIIDCAKAAMANGIPVAIGNDVGCPWITQYDFWREVYNFAKFTGADNRFALHTATAVNARLAGIGEVTGTVEEGKCADLIATQNNPLDDLRALEHVDMVIARGKIYDKPKYKINKKVKAELDKFC